MLSEYIENLLAACPEITEVWLIGSRANDKARLDSDWDLLVFGSNRTLSTLRKSQTLRHPDIDLLIVYNGNDFRAPWDTESGKVKTGSLTEWEWERDKGSHVRAHYMATKPGDDEFAVTTTREVAKRIWPKVEIEPEHPNLPVNTSPYGLSRK